MKKSANQAPTPFSRPLFPFFLISALQATANFIRDGQDLNFTNYSLVDLLFPPLSEQKEIAEYIEKESAKIDQAIALNQQQIAKLKKYKATLINSAVTGKIKVV